MPEKRVNRRNFFRDAANAGALAGYTLLVRVDGARGGESSGAPRPDFQQIAPPADHAARLAAEPNMTVADLACDVMVAGGGMAGVCAALAAARHGARVVLAQDRSRLGGNASSEVRMHIVGADCHNGRPGWREGGILEELRLENAVRNPHGAWELWDLMLYDKVVSEPNITLLLDATVYAAKVGDGCIREVLARCDRTEHIYRIRAAQYADCTGDSRLGLEAGALFRTGHESRAAFDEPLAPETEGPETLGSSILFTSKDYGHPVPFTPPPWARKITKEQLRHRGIRSWEYGYWWIEWGGMIDAIRDDARIRFELLSIVMGVWDYIKNSGAFPESATWGMDWVGMIPGRRSSRRLIGPYLLTQQDLMGLNGEFEDAVAIGGWSFDDHPPGGFDATEKPPCRQIHIEEPYNIPLRALFSANVKNLFMAGRNISASHVAFTSLRVMGTCAVEGQAIGTAAALCAREEKTPEALVADSGAVAALRQALLRDDQTIKGAKNEDPNDLARRARASASGEVKGSRAAHVLDGFVRDMPGEWEHRWGGPMTPEGAWIALEWDAPQTISHVQICFDSGFSRELTLSENQWVRTRITTGPQPETVRDYALQYWDDNHGDWKTIVEIAGNYQRLRRHHFPAVETKKLRLQITATNGDPEARVYEIRCYA